MNDEVKEYVFNKEYVFKEGSHYGNFTVTKELLIPEISCTLIELVHVPTGAHVMHIKNDDPENLFCLSFRTLPENSNGAPHILEHTVLCGSKKYPVKDPFFSMSRRSLTTFMNALTGQDFTCYPAATQVEQDFYNLLSVYIDAVFHPLLKPLSFSQEGHRLEFEKGDDPSSKLTFKGVVFNEMKGALSSPTTRLLEAVNEYLYPGSPYGYNSGGDPAEIPTLTHEALVDFHKKYYHPSRCLFFFYGNFPLAKHLDFLEEHALKGVEKVTPLQPIPHTERRLAPVRKELFYPVSSDEEEDDKEMVGFGFLTTSTLDGLTVLALNVLDIILMDTDASLLKHALLQSGICKQASSYLGSESLDVPYILVLKGLEEDRAQAAEELIQKTLTKIAEDGISEKAIESALHQLELSKLEIGTNGGGPFGLSLFGRSALLKQHGGKAEEGLQIYSLFQDLRKTLQENPRYLSELLVRYFINNKHFVRITLKPSQTLLDEEKKKEEERLEAISHSLTPSEKNRIIQETKELAAMQEAEEQGEGAKKQIETLPKISIHDVPQTIKDFDLAMTQEGNCLFFHHTAFTNHITYLDLLFPIPDLAEEDLWLLRLFTLLATQVGCANRNYQENLEYIQEHTGGVAAGFALYHRVDHPDSFTPSLYLKGKALYRKSDKLFSLIYEMATQLDLTDRKRIKELLVKHWTGLSNSINQNALRYAINLSASCLNSSSLIMQKTYGLDYFHKIRALVQHYEAREDQFIDDLHRMKELLLCNAGAHIVTTCDQSELSRYLQNGLYGLADLPAKQITPWKGAFDCPRIHPQGRIISSPVAFTAKAFTSASYSNPAAPSIAVLANLLENKTLHKRIREQGGAYGSGASYSAMTGSFYFYSYSDPNIASTLQAFQESIDTIKSGKFTDADLEEAKIGVIQGFDAPVSPGSRGITAYSWWREGKDKAMRKHFRDRCLSSTKEEVIQATKHYIAQPFTDGIVVSFGKRELLEEENKKMSSLHLPPLKIEKIS